MYSFKCCSNINTNNILIYFELYILYSVSNLSAYRDFPIVQRFLLVVCAYFKPTNRIMLQNVLVICTHPLKQIL